MLLTALHGSLRVSRTEVAGAQRKGVSFSQVLGFECVPSRQLSRKLLSWSQKYV